MKLIPKQQVSALESDSFGAVAPGVAAFWIELIRKLLVFWLILLYDLNAVILLGPSFQLLFEFLDLREACSFLPPIIDRL